MTRYLLGRDAAEDIEQIWEYIARDNVAAANRFVSKLIRNFEDIGRRPGIGHTRRQLTSADVLFWPVGNYIIIYRVKVKSRVEIVAVTEGSRNIPRLLTQRAPG